MSHLIEERKSKNKEEDDILQVLINADYSWENSPEKKSESAAVRKISL